MKTIHFIGIGGIGISALAQILKAQGHTISGSEMIESELTKKLQKSGIKISIGHNEKNISRNIDRVIYSLAIPKSNVELKKAKKLGIKTKTYGEALGELTKEKKTIAISGTHGKSTVTAMITKILVDAGKDPLTVIGTKMPEFNNQNFRIGKSDLMIVEACEYMETFLNFHPAYCIITNIEAEHLDYYKNFNNYFNAFKKFIKKIPKNGFAVLGKNVPKKINSEAVCKIIQAKEDHKFKLQILGKHNQTNAELAFLLTKELGIQEEQIKKSLEKFNGIWRRMEVKGQIGKTMIMDDYAHHPTEIRATLSAIREKYKKAKICCIFQPHQASRTKFFLHDFAKSFQDVDQVIIPNIYIVRDTKKSIESISVEKLIQNIKKYNKNVLDGKGLKNTLKYIKKYIKNFDIIITMGAGDVTQISELIF